MPTALRKRASLTLRRITNQASFHSSGNIFGGETPILPSFESVVRRQVRLQRELFVWRLLFAVVAAGAMIAAAAPQSTHDNPAKLLYVQPISPSATNKLALQKPTDYDFL